MLIVLGIFSFAIFLWTLMFLMELDSEHRSPISRRIWRMLIGLSLIGIYYAFYSMIKETVALGDAPLF